MPIIDFLTLILCGAAVGFIVGMTGVGGGSLMTPLLIVLGFPPQIAVGTDLLYASLTKTSGVVAHWKRHTIQWGIVKRLSMGSIPASLLTTIALWYLVDSTEGYGSLISTSLGIMLILTSIVLIFKNKLIKKKPEAMTAPNGNATNAFTANQPSITDTNYNAAWTIIMGIAMGVLVTLSSVGAGAFATAVLLVLYPKLSSIKVIGTDLAHAVPLTMVAGIGHLALGNVDYILLIALLIGSLPAIHIGTLVATRLPDTLMQPILAVALLGLGINYTFF